MTRFYPPLTSFYPPIISSISSEFALREKYAVFWYTNLQLTAERSHYLMRLKSLCLGKSMYVKARQRWVKARQATVDNSEAPLVTENRCTEAFSTSKKNPDFFSRWMSRFLNGKLMLFFIHVTRCLSRVMHAG